jgi:hypothetical protein
MCFAKGCQKRLPVALYNGLATPEIWRKLFQSARPSLTTLVNSRSAVAPVRKETARELYQSILARLTFRLPSFYETAPNSAALQVIVPGICRVA